MRIIVCIGFYKWSYVLIFNITFTFLNLLQTLKEPIDEYVAEHETS